MLRGDVPPPSSHDAGSNVACSGRREGAASRSAASLQRRKGASSCLHGGVIPLSSHDADPESLLSVSSVSHDGAVVIPLGERKSASCASASHVRAAEVSCAAIGGSHVVCGISRGASGVFRGASGVSLCGVESCLAPGAESSRITPGARVTGDDSGERGRVIAGESAWP